MKNILFALAIALLSLPLVCLVVFFFQDKYLEAVSAMMITFPVFFISDLLLKYSQK